MRIGFCCEESDGILAGMNAENTRSRPIRLLILEDHPADAERLLQEWRQAGFELEGRCVRTESEFVAGLDPAPALILAGHPLVQLQALSALEQVPQPALEIPFFIPPHVTTAALPA